MSESYPLGVSLRLQMLGDGQKSQFQRARVCKTPEVYLRGF